MAGLMDYIGGAASALGGSAISTLGNAFLQNEQNTQNVDMWNKANAYNSPKAQVQRLNDAGLNPNLVYGSGSVVGNTSTSTPTMGRASVDTPNIGGAISDYAQVTNAEEQTDNIRKQNDLLKAQAISVRANASNTAQDTIKKRADTDTARSNALAASVNAEIASRNKRFLDINDQKGLNYNSDDPTGWKTWSDSVDDIVGDIVPFGLGMAAGGLGRASTGAKAMKSLNYYPNNNF